MESSFFKLTRSGYDESYRELFLLGNGRLGYEGSLPDEDGGFHLVGVYDQCGDKWRESLNLFDPLRLFVAVDGRKLPFRSAKLSWSLDYRKAVLRFRAEWPEGVYCEERFLSCARDSFLAARSRFRAKKAGSYCFVFAIDSNPHDLNGPHYAQQWVGLSPLSIEAKSNEGRFVQVRLDISGVHPLEEKIMDEMPTATFRKRLCPGESLSFDRTAEALAEGDRPSARSFSYETTLQRHLDERKRRFSPFFPKAEGKPEFLGGLYDSAYRMSVLSNPGRITSIPARGVSGQVYKGAAFWDSETFMLPYFLLLEPEEAQSLLLYRIKTLAGAKEKARSLGYEGAYYAWESQEDGLERCSLFNVTDRKTGKGIRTYFADKAIHISADIVKAFSDYYRASGDSSLLRRGAIDVMVEVYRFYRSYASKGEDALFHLLDVVGPDEYHERVDDNAFTNYQVVFALSSFLEDLEKEGYDVERLFFRRGVKLADVRDFLGSVYLPRPNSEGIIEQFRGFFDREDISPATLAGRLEDPDDYWGRYASPTRVNKQADVVTLLASYPDRFPLEVLKANYEYYLFYTEHGSSLSHVMFGLLAAAIGKEEEAYEHYLASSRIDLEGGGKRFAGGIRISGSHPASLSGGFLILFQGFLGARLSEGRWHFRPRLPRAIERLEVDYCEQGKRKKASFERK